MTAPLTHLDLLEAESIHIFREAAAQFRKPVLLYSIGKDSTVLLHLARKAFYPARPPFPLLHVDTTWKFRDMIAFRDRTARELELIVHVNQQGVARGINPIDFPPSLYTDVMKTQGLRQALDKHAFDAAFGGARRDEEASRAKERVFSFRSEGHRWDPRQQRPEMWRLLNGRLGPGETARIFPLSNWTEKDVWRYIAREQLDVVPLYFAADRPTVVRNGSLLVRDDERMALQAGESARLARVRFRTLGCWPLTAAIPSDAADLDSVVAETLAARGSERAGRLIDHDEAGAMERKKQEGYF
jgi:sulfate adenylyltransferase subunit 2